jgi:hypothetical protein
LLLRERLVDKLPANEADVTANIIVSASGTRMIPLPIAAGLSVDHPGRSATAGG